MEEQKQDINIKFPDSLIAGSYANMMTVSHTTEEFVMDFMLVAPQYGSVVSRVICSPGHIKRILGALQDNVQRYEKQFGEIRTAKEPNVRIGF